MNKKIVSVVAMLLVCAIFVVSFLCVPTKVSAYEQINATVKEIEYQISASLELDGRYTANGMPLAFSSNPYDFVRSNDEFLKLVAMGMGAVDAIEICLADTENFSGLKGYMLAIALEEIYKVDLKQYQEYKWVDSESFIRSWNKVKEDVIEQVPEILENSGLTEEEKYEQIAKFGLLAIASMQQYRSQLTWENASASNAEILETIETIEGILRSENRSELVQVASECYKQESCKSKQKG